MKLNWRKIVLIVVCAELLFIYWNSISAIPFKKQQTTTHPITSPQSVPPLTQFKPTKPYQVEPDLRIIDQKAS
ncbi:hypothetical protein [Paenibacillus sp. N3.4]|uniref:hypothetical protein n=1 Tax=Paenibacillus sp. N3.4 TaxID=2603222 RepID=UPI0011C88DEF|nr:hypothetical protein [Paenibacillus sp. N3.4]TXK86074.1 hypothetical protein FU659_01145 [Paenibacillus sp. N3.4]